MNRQAKLKRCKGCRNNRYNMPAGWREGPNDAPVDGKGCWMLDQAFPCHKEVYWSPSDVTPSLLRDTLNCWMGAYGSGTVVTLKEHKENVKRREQARRSRANAG